MQTGVPRVVIYNITMLSPNFSKQNPVGKSDSSTDEYIYNVAVHDFILDCESTNQNFIQILLNLVGITHSKSEFQFVRSNYESETTPS